MFTYTPEQSAQYADLGIEGTTYQASFDALKEVFGDRSGMRVLDFGCGAGRSSRVLKLLGADRVDGIDRNATMVEAAGKRPTEGVEYHLASGALPLADATLDAALGAHVFVEMATYDEMLAASREIFRVLKPGGIFALITNNPDAIGRNFLSYSYDPAPGIRNGGKMMCTIHTENPFQVEDYYWDDAANRGVLADAGFIGIRRLDPLAEGDGWLDEIVIASNSIYVGVKPVA